MQEMQSVHENVYNKADYQKKKAIMQVCLQKMCAEVI